MMQDNSKRMGNHPLTHTLSSGATFISSLVYSLKAFKKGRVIKANITPTLSIFPKLKKMSVTNQSEQSDKTQ